MDRVHSSCYINILIVNSLTVIQVHAITSITDISRKHSFSRK